MELHRLAFIPYKMEHFFAPSVEIPCPLLEYLCRVYEDDPGNFHEFKEYAFLDTKRKNTEDKELYAYFIPNFKPDRQRWYLSEFKTEDQIQELVTVPGEASVPPAAAPAPRPVAQRAVRSAPKPAADAGQGEFQVDPIMRNILTQYAQEHGLKNQRGGFIFSRLVNQLILEDDTPECIGTDEELLDVITVDSDYDLGIDGICIQINDKIVPSVANLKSILVRDKYINKAEIFLIQSKFKGAFKLAEFDNFISGVRQFFEAVPSRKINDNVRNWLEIKNFLVEHTEYCQNMAHVSVRIFYAAYADWTNSSEILGDFDLVKRDIEAKENGFYKVERAVFITGDWIKKVASSNGRYFAPVIKAGDSRLTMAVSESVQGVVIRLRATELLKILINPETELLRKGLFDENVRDYQGETQVNAAIKETIQNAPESFVLRNNGITILVSRLEDSLFGTLKLSAPQIVNGCQTCNVIYYAYKEGLDVSKVEVIARIISTDDRQIITSIVGANNNQNVVYDLIYEISRGYHKKLEEYFEVQKELPVSRRVYYERRSKSLAYEQLLGYQKFPFRKLIQSAVVVWFGRPNEYVLNESGLLAKYTDRIFCDHHDPLAYYAAAALFGSYDKLVFDGQLDKQFRKCKAQACFLVVYQMGGAPDLNDVAASRAFSERLMHLVAHPDAFFDAVNAALDVFEGAVGRWLDERGDSHRGGIYDDPEFTKWLTDGAQKKAVARPAAPAPKAAPTFSGIIHRLGTDRYGHTYCFITRNNATIFAHQNYSPDTDFRRLQTGLSVVYEMGKDRYDKDWAVNVRIPGGKP